MATMIPVECDLTRRPMSEQIVFEAIRKGLSDDFLVGGCQITIIVLVCILDVTGTNPLGIKFFRNLLIILIDTIHFIHVEGSDGLSHLKDMVAYRNGLFINQ